MRSADRQLKLLERLQALLRESKYTTTYKFALLHALCDLALELPAGEHTVPLDKVAQRVIDLYWQQVVPFQVPRGAALVSLKQSTGGPAAAVALVATWRKRHRPGAGPVAQRVRDYAPAMLSVLRKDVLRRLQSSGKPILYREPIGAPRSFDPVTSNLHPADRVSSIRSVQLSLMVKRSRSSRMTVADFRLTATSLCGDWNKACRH